MAGVSQKKNTTLYLIRLFLFSLRDKAEIWLHSHGPNTFTTWDGLSKAFLNKYFLSDKTTKFRMDITSFNQQKDELLYGSEKGLGFAMEMSTP